MNSAVYRKQISPNVAAFCYQSAGIALNAHEYLHVYTSNRLAHSRKLIEKAQCASHFSIHSTRKMNEKSFLPIAFAEQFFLFFDCESLQLISSALMPPQWEPYKMLSRHEWCTNMQLCIPRRSCTTISFLRSVKLYTTRTCVVLKISCSGWCFFFSSYSRALPVDSLRRTHADYTWLLHDFVVKISFCECASDEKQFLAAPEIDDGREWIKYYWNIHRATRVPLPMLIKYLRSHKQNIFQSRLFFLCMLANGENAYHRIGLAA